MQIFIKTFGCSNNFSEGEIMAGLLSKEHTIVGNERDAEVIVLNICTVKGETVALREIKKRKDPTKKVIIAGCLTDRLILETEKLIPAASFISTRNINEISEVINRINKKVKLTHQSQKIKINLPRIRRNKIIGIVPILSGCVGSCSYCSVRLIKGKLLSYPQKSIIDEVNAALKDGTKEIWITSQDNACYGLDRKSNLVKLLTQIIKIDDNFKIRVGMMNPNNVLQMLDDLIEIYKNEKIFKFLHVPVQSGNDEVLQLMHRNYKVSDFEKIIAEFRKAIPEITISTDIMCGFPTETDDQFKDSLRLIKAVKPDVLNISRFVPRENTEAIKLKQVPGRIAKNRSREVAEIFGKISLERNKKWIGWHGKILIDEIGKNNSFVGRNYGYKPVVVRGDFKLGDCPSIKTVEAEKFYLIGTVSALPSRLLAE